MANGNRHKFEIIMSRLQITLLSLMAAAQPLLAADVGKLPPPSDKKGVTFEQDIQPIFKDNCVKCHGPQSQRSGLRLDSLEAALKGGKDGKVILPTNSANSSLVASVARVNERDAMPPIPRRRGPATLEGQTNAVPRALTVEEVSLIRAWIDQGAK